MKRTALLVITAACALFAQGTGQRTYEQRIEWGPTVLANGTTTINAGTDIRVTEITLSLIHTCSDTVVSAFDNAGTPLPLIDQVTLSTTLANGPRSISFVSPGRLSPAGVRLTASQASCVVGWLSGR